MKRTFIAIKTDFNTKNLTVYQELQNELKRESIKWVENVNMHLTIVFLGDTNENDINNIIKNLETIYLPFNDIKINIDGLGYFGSYNEPKVLWAGIQSTEQLQILYENTYRTLKEFDVKAEHKSFKPHLTLGRIKSKIKPQHFHDVIRKFSSKMQQNMIIDKILFFESILHNYGPEYKVLKEFSLNKKGISIEMP